MTEIFEEKNVSWKFTAETDRCLEGIAVMSLPSSEARRFRPASFTGTGSQPIVV
jgi:hypothetical protein